MSTIPLTTHAAPDNDLFAPAALCGATSATTSTGSMRMTAGGWAVDCVVCLDLLARRKGARH